MPAIVSCTTIRKQTPTPSSLGLPYMPESTYMTAWPSVMARPASFCAPSKSSRSSLLLWSTWISLAPASSCITMPAVTMGEMPSSMRVPRLEAMITRIQ